MQPRKKSSVWQRKVVNGNRYACKSKLCVKIFFVRQRPTVHGKHGYKLIEPIRNRNVKQRQKMLGHCVCRIKLAVKIFFVRQRLKMLGYRVCMIKLTVKIFFVRQRLKMLGYRACRDKHNVNSV